MSQTDYVTSLIPDRHREVTDLHRGYVNGTKVNDIRKNTRDMLTYVTRQDAACNLPALYNVLQNLFRIVNAIVSLSKDWLGKTGNRSPAYSQAVQQYMIVCLSIESFARDSMSTIKNELLQDPSIGEALKELVKNVDHNEKGVKNLLEIVLSDVDVILPRATIKRSAFGFMSPVFNALFYAEITGVTEAVIGITDVEHNVPLLLNYIKQIANVRLNKALAFGKIYEKLPYSNTLTSEDRTVSRNILHLNNIINININPIKLSYMHHTPLFYTTEVFSRVFDRSVKEFITASYNDFSDADKETIHAYRGVPGSSTTLKGAYTGLIDFMVDPMEYFKVNRPEALKNGGIMPLPEEFKNGTTRGRNVAAGIGHPIKINDDGITTRLLYFWTKEVYKFTRNFVVNRISQSSDNGGIYQNRGMNSLVRNEHIFK